LQTLEERRGGETVEKTVYTVDLGQGGRDFDDVPVEIPGSRLDKLFDALDESGELRDYHVPIVVEHMFRALGKPDNKPHDLVFDGELVISAPERNKHSISSEDFKAIA